MAQGRTVRVLGAVLLAAAVSGCVGVAYPYQQPQTVVVEPGRYSLPADVLFAFDSAVLRPGATAALEEALASIRQQYQYPAIRVEGSTDGIGSDAVNNALSLARAQAVGQWLMGHGVPRGAITEVGYGKTRPVAANALPNGADNPAGRAQNRRVDLVASPAT